MRAIFFILLIILIFLIIRFTLQRIRIIRAKQDAETRAQEHAEKMATQTMVTCNICQVHLPQNEALKEGDLYYCSEEHRQQGIKQNQ